MPDSFDDMPEIELDDIISQPPKKADDAEAIELDLDFEASPPAPAPPATVVPLRRPEDDSDAIDLGIDIDEVSPNRPTKPLADIDVDALASQVAEGQAGISALNDSGPAVPEDDTGHAPVVEMPFAARSQEASVDLDALLAGIDSGVDAAAKDSASEGPPMPRIESRTEALPDVGNDPMSALNVDLEVKPPSAAPRPPPSPKTVELQAADVIIEAPAPLPWDVEPSDGGGELEVDAEAELDREPSSDTNALPALETEYGEATQTVEIDSSSLVATDTLEGLPALPADLQELASEIELDAELQVEGVVNPDEGDAWVTAEPATGEERLEPLIDALADADDEAALRLDDDSQLSFEAEHAPIGEELSAPPPTVSPIDDPEAPSLPLSLEEPPGRPKVPLEALQPDPKTIEKLKRLAGFGGDAQLARTHLVAAFRGEPYDKRAMPDAADIAIGIGRFLVQSGHDADALAEAILTVMLE